MVGKWEVYKEDNPRVFIPFVQKTYQFLSKLGHAQEILKEAQKEDEKYVLEEFVYYDKMKCSVPKRLIVKEAGEL